MKYFEYKSIKAEVKDVDIVKGIVTGYFSAFDSVDSDNDVIVKGAFSKTLQENGKRIKHLWQHDVRYPLSKPTEIKEDNYGLYFESKISQTSYGKDVLKLYQDGVIDEHSIGFRTIKNADKKDYNEIQEVKLWEGSTVTFGANPNTPFLGMKGMSAEDVIVKMDAIHKALKSGTYEQEEVFENLEIYHNQLKQYLNEITQPVKMVKCVHCGNETEDVESGMGYIKCSSCNNTFSSQTVEPKSELDSDLILAHIFLTEKSLIK